MKDQELRKILIKSKTIDQCSYNGNIESSYISNKTLAEAIYDLREQLDAINKHYGITVKKSTEEYVVVED